MFKSFRITYVDINDLQPAGIGFFFSPSVARKSIEEFYEDPSTYSWLHFGWEARPQHGIGGFLLTSVMIPENNILAERCATNHHKENLLSPKDYFFINTDADAPLWNAATALRGITKTVSFKRPEIKPLQTSATILPFRPIQMKARQKLALVQPPPKHG